VEKVKRGIFGREMEEKKELGLREGGRPSTLDFRCIGMQEEGTGRDGDEGEPVGLTKREREEGRAPRIRWEVPEVCDGVWF